LRFQIVSKPTTLTCFWEADPKATAVIPSYDKMAYFIQMEKLTGIKIDFLHPPVGQTNQQIALMLSTNDLPDMVWYDWTRVPGGVAALLQDGTLQNLTKWWAQYSPNIKKIYDGNAEIKREALLNDGTFYNYPKVKGAKSICITTGMMIRADWLKKVNLPPPTCIDEWYTVLKAFKTMDANGNGDPNDEIPFVGLTPTPTGATSPVFAFALAWNLMFDDFSTRDNGKTIVFGPMLPEYRDFVEIMRKWYSEGLIDADYISTNSQSQDAKILGNVGGAFRAAVNGGMGKYFDTWIPEGKTSYDIMAVISPSRNPGGPHYSDVQAMTSVEGVAITGNNKFPTESMQYLDYGYSPDGIMLQNYGIEGESYTMVDGKPKLTELITKNPKGYPIMNALHMFNFSSSQGPGVQLEDLFFQIAIYPRQVEAYKNWTDGINKINLPPFKLSVEDGARVSKIMGDVQTFVNETVNKFVMGVEPMSGYDAFVKQLSSMNVQEAIALEQKGLDAFNSK